jgi:leucyl aminopeptidase (aminopeptidase T)
MEVSSLLDRARVNLHDSVALALEWTPGEGALLVYDEQSELAALLGEAYRAVLPNAKTLNFDRTTPKEILAAIDALAPKALVALVQTTSFRLNEFRIRVELFKRGLKAIEHPHLGRIREEERATYIDALAYDPTYYRSVGPALKERIDRAAKISVICEETELIYDSPFEVAKLNIGDYRGMKNTGGQFPIGEVFSEPAEVRQVNGTLQIFAFGDTHFTVHAPDRPFSARIEGGILVAAPDAPKAFQEVLEQIRAEEEAVWVRELGFGLNRALTRDRRLSDIGAYERMLGIHLSLGAKHALYTKPGFSKSGKFHVDIFAAVERVEIDGEKVFEEGRYII